MENETVLIVDDDNDAVEILELFLSSMNYQTLAACNGKSGLKIALERHPDLIFLDLNMPIMGGLEMLKELHQKECALPVIFVTANGSEKIAIEAFRLGVREYLNKPFTGDEVRRVMDHALRETRLAREREILNHNLHTAEAVRVTAVTLSHYLNNYLTA
ncbi:MAG: response regulator, partial [Anaerolineaceae bacterium]